MEYTIHYIDGDDRVQKTEGGFSTLEHIHQSNAQLIRVRKGESDILSVVGGALDDIAKLAREGLVDTGEPNQRSGDRLPGVDAEVS